MKILQHLSALAIITIIMTLIYASVQQTYRSNANDPQMQIVNDLKNNLQEGKPIKVVSDQVRTPTYVEDLAKGVLLAVEKGAKGIYHISGEKMLSPYDMAMATAAYTGLDAGLIEKVDAAIFSQPAQRPAKTGFIIDKARQELGFEPLSFGEGLRKMLPGGF